MMTMFLFSASAAHPALPTFPTRRSSDLQRRRGEVIGPHLGMDAALEVAVAAEDAGDDEVVVTSVRSEEHTSELQSLTNLVCRLLLEKKKKIIQQKNPSANADKIGVQASP